MATAGPSGIRTTLPGCAQVRDSGSDDRMFCRQ